MRTSLGADAPAAPPSNAPWGWLCAACGLALALIAWGVHGGPGQVAWQRLDLATQAWATAHMQSAPAAWPTLLQGFTHLGDVLFLAIVTVAFAVYLMRQRRWLDVQVWLFFCTFNGLAIRVLKLAAGRERPENLHGLLVSGASFPSGHSAGSVLVYGLLAALLSAALPPRHRALWLVLAAAWTLCIGLSRVLLAAHWASDVAAGWALGLASLCAALAVLQRLRG
jgi:undecaprenyl-diphosphatase